MLAEHLQRYRSIVFSALGLLATLALLIAALLELPPRAVLIEPIQVPPALVGEGYTPEVVALRLMDEILAVSAEARRQTGRSKEQIALEWVEPDVEVPAAGVTLGTLVRYVRQKLGISATRISGEITIVRDAPALRLRQNGGGRLPAVVVPSADSVTRPSLDELIRQGAMHILGHVDPYILAVYLHERAPTTAERLIRRCLEQAPAGDDAWALNLWGLMLQKRGRHEDALVRYNAAIAARPSFILAHLNRIEAFHRTGADAAEVERQYRSARGTLGAVPALYHHWGDHLARLGAFDRADEKLTHAAALGRRSRDLGLSSGLTLLQWGRTAGREDPPSQLLFERASARFRRLVTTHPLDPKAHLHLGESLFELGRPRDALRHFKLSYALNDSAGPDAGRTKRWISRAERALVAEAKVAGSGS